MEPNKQKIETNKQKIEVSAELLNASKIAFKNNSTNKEYNYSLCVDNLKALNTVLNLGLSEAQIADIQKNKTKFVSEKTKSAFATNPFYSKVKKQIRNNSRLFYANKGIDDKIKMQLTLLIQG